MSIRISSLQVPSQATTGDRIDGSIEVINDSTSETVNAIVSVALSETQLISGAVMLDPNETATIAFTTTEVPHASAGSTVWNAQVGFGSIVDGTAEFDTITDQESEGVEINEDLFRLRNLLVAGGLITGAGAIYKREAIMELAGS